MCKQSRPSLTGVATIRLDAVSGHYRWTKMFGMLPLSPLFFGDQVLHGKKTAVNTPYTLLEKHGLSVCEADTKEEHLASNGRPSILRRWTTSIGRTALSWMTVQAQ
jgi:hypothetical protein